MKPTTTKPTITSTYWITCTDGLIMCDIVSGVKYWNTFSIN
jgi:hypothetical protein